MRATLRRLLDRVLLCVHDATVNALYRRDAVHAREVERDETHLRAVVKATRLDEFERINARVTARRLKRTALVN